MLIVLIQRTWQILSFRCDFRRNPVQIFNKKCYLISGQCSNFMPAKSTREPKVFWCFHVIYGSGYSRMDWVKFLEDSLLENWSDIVCLSWPYHFIFFKGSLPQVLLGPFLNTLTYMIGTLARKKVKKPQMLFNAIFVLMKKLIFTAFLFDILDGWLCRRYVFAQKIIFAQNIFSSKDCFCKCEQPRKE